MYCQLLSYKHFKVIYLSLPFLSLDTTIYYRWCCSRKAPLPISLKCPLKLQRGNNPYFHRFPVVYHHSLVVCEPFVQRLLHGNDACGLTYLWSIKHIKLCLAPAASFTVSAMKFRTVLPYLCCVQIVCVAELGTSSSDMVDSRLSRVPLAGTSEVVCPDKPVFIQDDCCAAFINLSQCRECHSDNKSICRFHSFRRW